MHFERPKINFNFLGRGVVGSCGNQVLAIYVDKAIQNTENLFGRSFELKTKIRAIISQIPATPFHFEFPHKQKPRDQNCNFYLYLYIYFCCCQGSNQKGEQESPTSELEGTLNQPRMTLEGASMT